MNKYDDKYVDCPACHSKKINDYHSDFRGNSISICNNCNVQFMNPVYSDEYLDDFKNRTTALPNENYWKEKRVLITGISGFAGSHLAEQLLDLGCEVHGTIRRHAVPMHENIEHLRGKINLHEADITSAERINRMFEEIQPNAVFHLAAESFIPTSFREPVRVTHNNIIGTINIFEAARRFDTDLESVQVACSSEQYGLVDPSEVPVTEDLKKNPFSVILLTISTLPKLGFLC